MTVHIEREKKYLLPNTPLLTQYTQPRIGGEQDYKKRKACGLFNFHSLSLYQYEVPLYVGFLFMVDWYYPITHKRSPHGVGTFNVYGSSIGLRITYPKSVPTLTTFRHFVLLRLV